MRRDSTDPKPRDLAELELREHRHADALERLAPEWIELWQRTPGAAFFLRPEWLVPWWRHFGQDKQLRLLAAHAADRLVALLPLCAYAGAGRRQLMLLGTGNTDRLDALVSPEAGSAVQQAWGRWLADTRPEWDECYFTQLPHDSALLGVEVPADTQERIEPAEPCTLIDLRGARSALDLTRTGAPSRLAYYRRRAAREGMVLREASPGELPRMLELLFELHTARWVDRQQAGVMADARVRGFLCDVVMASTRSGSVHLCALEQDGRMLAGHLGFAAGHRLALYVSGFAPEASKLSPGTLLFGCSIDLALERGINGLDLLRGQEAYKYNWGARDDPLHTRTLSADEPAGA
jgi:CelD/BcsL family acetyltransferase involved in cellulose biosynthesis